MRLVLAALVAGTGCAQIFGLDTTTGADANTDLATLTVQRVSIGASVNKGPQDLSGQTAKFIQMDGSEVDGALDAMGRFTSETLGTPPVMFTVPSMTDPRRLVALSQRRQVAPFVVFEHPSPTAPATTSEIMLSIALPSAYVSGQSFTVRSIGAWMGYSLVAGDLPAPDMAMSNISAKIPYSSFKTLITGNADARIIATDFTLLLRYTASALTGVFQAQFDQTDATDTMSGTMTTVTADKTFTSAIDTAAVMSRFTAVRPTTAAPTISWRMTASPGYSVGSDTGVQLDTESVAASPVTKMYANPFESLDWKALLTFVATSARTYSLSDGVNMVNVSLSTTMQETGEPASLANITMGAGLATTIQADQTLLSIDGAMVKLDLTKPVPFSAVVDQPSNTLFELVLVELGIDTSGASPKLTRTTKVHAYTLASGTMVSFSIPAELFTVNKSYYVTFRSTKGLYTGAATGDLTTLSLPFTSSTIDSAVFQVMP